MKHLFLVANTSFDKIDTAIQTLSEESGKDLNSLFIYGMYHDPSAVFRSEVCLLLGTDAFAANQSFFNPDSVGFMFADPMFLSCIEKHKNVTWLDFDEKEDGFGFYMRKLSPSKIKRKLKRALAAKLKEIVKVEQFDPIPKIINSAKSTTSFLPEYQGVYYSIGDLMIREKFKSQFVKWLLSDEDAKSLRKMFIKLTGMAKSKRIVVLQDFFDTHEGEQARKALQIVARSIKAEKTVEFIKITAKFNVSSFDLRYMASLFKKSALLMDVDSNAAHQANSKFRFVEEED